VLQWFGGEATVSELVQSRKYGKAEQLLRKQFEAGRRDADLRLQLADVLALDGRGAQAVPIYIGLADEFARTGHAARAIAVLKKLEQVAPGRGDVAERLAALIGDHGAGAEAAGPPPLEAAPALEMPVAQAGDMPVAPASAPGEGEDVLILDAGAAGTSEPDGVLVLDAGEVTAPAAAARPEKAAIDPAFSSPLFGDFSREDLLAVFQGLRFRAFQPGDIIVGDGEPGDSLFVISSGRVKAFVKGPEGRYRVARELGEGDFFGEIAILYGRPRTATVTAAAPCELLELERMTVETLASTRPRVREVLEAFCTSRIGG
jgi:hypothetical protein